MTDKLYREIEAAKSLRLYLADVIKGDATSEMTEDDQQVLQDSFDGEATSLEDAIRAAYLAMDEDEIDITGIAARIAELKSRQDRLKKRVEMTRGLIEQAMTVAEWPKFKMDIATITLGKAPAKVVIDEESEIPTQFWKRGDPVLDKDELSKALKDRQKRYDDLDKLSGPQWASAIRKLGEEFPPIPGAHLETNLKTLTIRKG